MIGSKYLYCTAYNVMYLRMDQHVAMLSILAQLAANICCLERHNLSTIVAISKAQLHQSQSLLQSSEATQRARSATARLPLACLPRRVAAPSAGDQVKARFSNEGMFDLLE